MLESGYIRIDELAYLACRLYIKIALIPERHEHDCVFPICVLSFRPPRLLMAEN